MNRYLDAEWLKGRVHDVTLANGALHGCIDKLDIHEAPSIDIVFCRECRYGEYRADFDDYECRYSGCGLVYNADDFCSYGVKKGVNDDRI